MTGFFSAALALLKTWLVTGISWPRLLARALVDFLVTRWKGSKR